MAERKSQRLINLVVVLLSTRRFLSREEIRERVEGYAGKDDMSFQRMFERDKEELRSMGITILTGSDDRSLDEDDAYQIEASTFFLPEIHLTPQESTLVGLASTVWNQEDIAADVRQAVVKLRASGATVSDDAIGALAPHVTAREPAFSVLWNALLTRTPVEFTYHGKKRRVNPWRLMLRWGAWYLICEAIDGEDPKVRIFKLARMETVPVELPGTYTAPDPLMVDEKANELEPPQPSSEAVLAVRLGAAPQLRRRATVVDDQGPMGYDIVRLPYAREDELVSTVVEASPDVLVIEPREVRDAVVARLQQIVGEER